MTTNVQAEGLTGYLATAAELRRIAAALADLPSPTEAPPYVSLTFIPNKGDTTEETVAIIDALARAVTGKEATTERSGGSWYHLARSSNAKMYLTVQGEVPGPPDERDAELVRLRAENERLRAAVPAVPNYGRGDEARPGEVADQPAESKAWTHYRNDQTAKTAYGQLVADLPLDDGTSSDHAEVTCKACIDGLPF